jgi:hypothetical protein
MRLEVKGSSGNGKDEYAQQVILCGRNAESRVEG